MSGRDWRGAVALITGANKGIGRAAAEQLAAMGLTVLISSRDQRLRSDCGNQRHLDHASRRAVVTYAQLK